MGLIFFAFFEKFFVPILTSGGPASFIMPLQIGKTPIVVPRQHQFNEHVNDHQVEFARNVAQRMGTIIPVEDIETLGDIITNYDQIVAGIGYQSSTVLDEPEREAGTTSIPIPQREESENIPLPDLSGQLENVQQSGNEIAKRGMPT